MKKKSDEKSEHIRAIATNPNAKKNFALSGFLEAGLVLTGTEVKSLRAQSPNLRDAFVDFRSNGPQLEAFLVNAHIPPYSHGNIWNHEPLRARKLLLHTIEIKRLFGFVTQKGMTAVPTRMYFKKGIAKVEVALGKGKKKEDRREAVKKRGAQREMDRARKQSLKRG